MEIANIASKVEDLQIGLWALSGLIMAVQDAAFHGTFAAQDYDGAMWGLQVFSQSLEKETKKIVDAMYEAIWEENELVKEKR